MAKVADLLLSARLILNEVSTQNTWTQAELLKWFNDGVREVIKLDPMASQDIVTLTLDQGAKQALPADTWVLLDVIGNVDANGGAGPQIRVVDRTALDASFPKWQMESPKTTVKNVMYDPKLRMTYWVYPPVEQGVQIEVLLSYFPAEAVNDTADVALEQQYHSPLVDYVLYRAFSKDAEDASSMQRAAAYFTTFKSAINDIVAVRSGASTTKE